MPACDSTLDDKVTHVRVDVAQFNGTKKTGQVADKQREAAFSHSADKEGGHVGLYPGLGPTEVTFHHAGQSWPDTQIISLDVKSPLFGDVTLQLARRLEICRP